MNNKHDNEEEFLINGNTVYVEWKQISGEMIKAVEDEIRKDNFSRAEGLFVGGSINRMTYNGKTIIRPLNRSGRRSNAEATSEPIPGDYNAETDEFLMDMLLKGAVKRAPWAARRQPHSEVFEKYADDEVPGKDPTKSPGGTPKQDS